MIDNLITKFVLWWLHRQYLKYGQPIFYIKGTEELYLKYMLYTEDENVWHRMDRF